MAMREDGHVPGGKRICLCIAEDDLRSWVTEELLLITWVVQPAVVTPADAEVTPGAGAALTHRFPPASVTRLTFDLG